MKRFAGMMAIGALLGGAVHAQPATSFQSPHYIASPSWLAKPTGGDIDRLYPPLLKQKNAGAAGLLECRINGSGKLEDCRTLHEAPTDAGVGEAMMRISTLLRARLTTEEGESTVDRLVLIPLVFRVPDGSNSVELPDNRAATSAYAMTDKRSGKPTAAVPCGLPEAPDRQCYLHRFQWRIQPPYEVEVEWVEKIGRETGQTVMTCSLTGDGAPMGCLADEPLTAAEATHMSSLLKLYRAPPRTIDGTDLRKNKALLVFDWAEMHKLIEASALKRPR